MYRNAAVKKQGFTTKESAKNQFGSYQPQASAIPQQAAAAYLQSIGAVAAPSQVSLNSCLHACSMLFML
jgi:hypothetical protein